MRNLFITLGIGLAMTGCFKSTAKVSSGKFAALETQLAASSTGASSSSISGGSGTTNGSLPTSVQAQVNYVGSFYNYQNPTVTMGQTVFAG